MLSIGPYYCPNLMIPSWLRPAKCPKGQKHARVKVLGLVVGKIYGVFFRFFCISTQALPEGQPRYSQKAT